MKKKNSELGVTLVTLVVTIIVLLILAGITINIALGNNGLLNKSEMTVGEHNKQEATEKINFKITTVQMHTYAKEQRMPTLQELANDLCEDNEIEYVELEAKKVGGLTKVDVGERESIFTKLKDYQYEFEINSSLQLASINGVKIAVSTPNNDATKPTGIKTSVFIKCEKATTSTYAKVTNMNGYNWEADTDNNIFQYLSYSEEDGFTVLKDGWYFIKMEARLNSSSAADVNVVLNINSQEFSKVSTFASSGCAYNADHNDFPIYLETRYKDIFFNITGINHV